MFGRRPVGDQRLIDRQRAAVGERRQQRFAAPLEARRQDPEAQPYAGALELVAQAGAHVLVEAPEHVVGAHDLRHLGAELGEQAGEFDRDIAAADHQQAPRKGRKVENLVRRDRELEPGKFGRRLRPRARRNEDVARADRAPVRQSQRVPVDDVRALLDQRRPGRVEAGAIGADRRAISHFSLPRGSASRSAAARLVQPKPAAAANSSAKRLA